MGGELNKVRPTAPKEAASVKLPHPAHHNLDVLKYPHKKTSKKLASMRLWLLERGSNPGTGFCQYMSRLNRP